MICIVLALVIAVIDVPGLSTSEGRSGRSVRSPSAWIEAGELFRSARRGDREAWSEILERYLPLIRAIARAYRLNSADVDDVGQTVCLRLVEHIHRIRKPDALPAWIATAARHESLRLVRRGSRVIPVECLDDASSVNAPGGGQDLDANLLNLELAEVLCEGLSELPANQRELLMLLSSERQRSYREIGNILAMPIGSIGPTRSRGLARLKATRALHDYLADVDGTRGRRSA